MAHSISEQDCSMLVRPSVEKDGRSTKPLEREWIVSRQSFGRSLLRRAQGCSRCVRCKIRPHEPFPDNGKMHLFRSVALADAIAQRMVTVATKRYIMGNYN